MSKPLILAAAAILATGIVAVVLWPRESAELEQDPGVAGFSLPVLVQQTSRPESGNDTKRHANQSASATRQVPGKGRNPRLDSLDLDALREEYAASARAKIKERLGPEGLASRRKLLEQRHAELGKFLDLAPEELKRLLDLLSRLEVERENLRVETSIADLELVLIDGIPMQLTRDGVPEPRDAESLSRRQEDELRSVLGSKYDRWLAYGVAPEIRTSVLRFQDVFGPDANPLSDEQTEAVVAALATEQVRINRDMRNIPRTWSSDPQTSLQNSLDWTLRYASENNRRLVEAASPFLNAGQIVDYREMLEEDRTKSIDSLRARIARQETPQVIPGRP